MRAYLNGIRLHMRNFLVLYILIIAVSCLKAQDTKIAPRPQEPIKPYPYLSEDVTFQNKEANITLSGTLTLPKDQSDFPVVVLISGSSPHNRNEEIAGHKPFLVIADYLTRHGIGVLRYDDRGVGQSEGKYEIAAYADRTSDVESAITYLKTRKEVNQKKIGLIGHSEGGLIAAMVAEHSKDVNFIILMAAPGLTGYDMVLLQTEISNKTAGTNDEEIQKEVALLKSIFDVVIKSDNLDEGKFALTESLLNQLKEYPTQFPEGLKAKDLTQMVETFTALWFQRILMSNPGASLRNVECPVLAINGGKDMQILPKENLSAIRNALEKSGNEKFLIMELPNLNHLFQEAQTGLQEEFSTIEQTISPVALKEITTWIRTNK
ncbi:MAG: alpha/beta fold hydrolase [Cyclobacteriaceae bacterium]